MDESQSLVANLQSSLVLLFLASLAYEEICQVSQGG